MPWSRITEWLRPSVLNCKHVRGPNGCNYSVIRLIIKCRTETVINFKVGQYIQFACVNDILILGQKSQSRRSHKPIVFDSAKRHCLALKIPSNACKLAIEGLATNWHKFLIIRLWARTSIRRSDWVVRAAFRHLRLGVALCCGVGGPHPGGRPSWLLAVLRWVRMGDMDRNGPQNPAQGVLKFPGTVLVTRRRNGSRVTWRLAVQFKMS